MKTKILRATALLFSLISFSFFNRSANAQVPEIVWQKEIGGLQSDLLHSFCATPDGGYLCGGRSLSGIGGDKTQPFFGGTVYGDYWVVKLDSSRNIQWQKTLGGTSDDYLAKCIPTADGGYLVGGYSSSPVSGNKTEGNLTTDYWIVKLDALGNISWQNTIGGNFGDWLTDLDEAPGGGYYVAGYSASDISGDKTGSRIGVNDFWILKLNTDGTIIWQKTLGGDSFQDCNAMVHTADGGCIVAGYSSSGISGTKTSVNYGSDDYWVIKLDAAGNTEWEKTYGGDKSDQAKTISETPDGGFIIGGSSGSGISGVKTEPSFDDSGLNKDIWVIKIDATGNLIGQHTIGTITDDVLNSILTMPDGSMLLSCYMESGALSGNLTEPSHGSSDIWLIRLDKYGDIVWQNTIGGSSSEVSFNILPEADGFVVGAFSQSGISGDKTLPSVGSNDFWLFKVGSECSLGNEICNGVDDDCNGLTDEGLSTAFTIYSEVETTFCQGEIGRLTAYYPGADLQWKRNGHPVPGAVYPEYYPTTKGTYTCVAVNACDTITSNPILITVNKNPPANITAGGPITFCAGGSVVLTANAGGGLTYKWYKNLSVISGATSMTYTATTAGKYKCRVTKSATGCFLESNIIKVTVNCRLGEAQAQDIDIYPNPASDYFIISGSDVDESVTLKIFDPLGRLVHTQIIYTSDGSFTADVDALKDAPAGIYVVYVTDSTSVSVHKLVLQ